MGRIDLATEDNRNRSSPTATAQRTFRAAVGTSSSAQNGQSSVTPIRRPVTAQVNSGTNRTTPGSARARVDLSGYTFASPDPRHFHSPSSSVSAPVTPQIGVDSTAPAATTSSFPNSNRPVSVLSAGPSAGFSARSPSPTRPSPRPGLVHAASSNNITPRTAARLRRDNPSESSTSSSSSTVSAPIPHSHTVASISQPSAPASSTFGPRSGRSSPVRPAYLGHARANTHYTISSSVSLRPHNAAPQRVQVAPLGKVSMPPLRSTSPIRSSSPDGQSTVSYNAQPDGLSTAQFKRRSVADVTPRPALTPLQVAGRQENQQQQQQQRRRVSSGQTYAHPTSPSEPSKPATVGPSSGAGLLRSHDNVANAFPRPPAAATTTAAIPQSPPRLAMPFLPMTSQQPLLSPTKFQQARTVTSVSQPPTGSSGWSSGGLLSPTSEVSSAEPLEYAQLRVERKIADLEITNKSLLAINSGLEVTKHRQAREIRDLKRRLRERATNPALAGSDDDFHDAQLGTSFSDDEDQFSTDDDTPDDPLDADAYLNRKRRSRGSLPREDPELAAAHVRCKALIDNMLQQARECITSQYVHDTSKSKVLTLGEFAERQQGEGDVTTGDVSNVDESFQVDSTADTTRADTTTEEGPPEEDLSLSRTDGEPDISIE